MGFLEEVLSRSGPVIRTTLISLNSCASTLYLEHAFETISVE